MNIKPLLAGILFAAISTNPQTASAQSTLFTELDQAFTDLARSCLGTRYRAGDRVRREIGGERVRTAIPANILDWDPLEARLNDVVEYSNDQSLQINWGYVYLVDGDSRTRLQANLELVDAKPDSILTIPFYDSEVYTHNCVTMVSAGGGISADTPIFRAATNAAISSETAINTYTFAGRAISPYAVALGQGGVGTEDVEIGASPAAYLARLWQWYRRNPEHIDSTLEIDAQLRAISIYSTRNSTQDRLLRARASGGFGFGPISARVRTRFSNSNQLQVDSIDVETAILDRLHQASLPTAENVAARLGAELSLDPAGFENPVLVGTEIFTYRAGVRSLPNSLCDNSAWALGQDGPFTLLSSEVGLDPAHPEMCIFRWNLRLTADEASAHNLTLTANSSVGDAANPVTLEIDSPPITLADSRALLGLIRPEIAMLNLPAVLPGSASSHSASYAVVEVAGARLSNINRHASTIEIACDGMESFSTPPDDVVLSGATSGRTVELQFRLPPGWFSGLSQGGKLTCQMDGVLRAEREGARPSEVELAIPSWSFVVSRALPPAE